MLISGTQLNSLAQYKIKFTRYQHNERNIAKFILNINVIRVTISMLYEKYLQ